MAAPSTERVISSDDHADLSHDRVKSFLASQFHDDYDRAVDAYDRANALQRRGDEEAADRALDEGLAAIGSAQERLAGRKPRS